MSTVGPGLLVCREMLAELFGMPPTQGVLLNHCLRCQRGAWMSSEHRGQSQRRHKGFLPQPDPIKPIGV